MASKPNEYLTWDPSLSNVIDPPSGLKSTGYIPGQVPDSQHHNWIFNLTDQWIQWLDQQTSLIQTSRTTTYSVAANIQTVLANPSGGTFAVTLPAASSVSAGRRFTIKNTGIGSSNLVNVTPTGADTIEGTNAAFALAQGDVFTFESDGVSSYWQVA